MALKNTYRGKGIGNKLMDKTMKFIEKQFGKENIRISAQTHLLTYYQGHGFEQVGEGYLEDDIPHIEMFFDSSRQS